MSVLHTETCISDSSQLAGKKLKTNVCPVILRMLLLSAYAFTNLEWTSEGRRQCLQCTFLDYSLWGTISWKGSNVLKLYYMIFII
jgi:hypothetical protein